MKGIFVNEDGCVKYALAIVQGYKTVETRSKNMLRPCVGERVAVIRTRRGHNPTIIGYVTIDASNRYSAPVLDRFRNRTLIPVGSKYDTGARWCYFLSHAEVCDPYPIPSSTVRHGRSWAEWDDATDALSWSEAVADAMTEDDWNHLHDGEDQMRELF